MLNLIFIAVGGAIGAVLRYLLSSGTHELLGRGFPYGTLLVNIIGSFLIGVCFVLFTTKLNLEPHWKLGITVGVLGAFTTFSTFSMETINLLYAGESVKAGVNVLFSIVLCFLACWAGLLTAKLF